ncbi:hypothetical protein JCM8547_000858 [Rhodosporidiobolus lusitaniae]
MFTTSRTTPQPAYAPSRPSTPPPRPSSPFRRPPSPARPTPPPSPQLYRTPFRRNSVSAQPSSPSYSPTRPVRPPSPSSSRQAGLGEVCPGAMEVFGDSFAGVFSLLKSKVRVHRFKGASGRGLNNPNSTLGVGPIIVQQLELNKPSSCLLQFGHCDFLNYLWQLKAKGPSAIGPADWVEKIARDYTSFLATQVVPIAQRYGIKVYVAGVTPPIVEDSYLELASQKYLEKEGVGLLPPLSRAIHPHDLSTRAHMVKRLNSLLSTFCARYHCLNIVDISRFLVSSSEPRRVAAPFRDPVDPTNIHLVWESTLSLWCRAIPELRALCPSSHRDLANLERGLEKWRLEKQERMQLNELTRHLVTV